MARGCNEHPGRSFSIMVPEPHELLALINLSNPGSSYRNRERESPRTHIPSCMRSCFYGGSQRRRRLRDDSWACHLARLRSSTHGIKASCNARSFDNPSETNGRNDERTGSRSCVAHGTSTHGWELEYSRRRA